MGGLSMKKYTRILAVAVLSLCLTLPSALANSISSIRSYGDAGFTDVADDWSLPYISACYELGLMSGRGSGLFAPNGSVSVAEGITVAARVHNLWRGGAGSFDDGEFWYSGALTYALKTDILSEGEFSDYTSPISRKQLAGLLARALPAEEYLPINSIAILPDITWDEPYGQEIFTLYNAGIITGTDSYGTFLPNAAITRAELSAILCRLVNPGTRQSFSPLAAESTSKGLTILFFYATWCEPCRNLTPTIDQLDAKYQPQGVPLQRIDVDKQSTLAALYQVNSYPTVVFLWNGQEVDRRVGSMSFDDYCAIVAQWL